VPSGRTSAPTTATLPAWQRSALLSTGCRSPLSSPPPERGCTPRALLPLLESRLALLIDGPRDLPPRQRTLRAALDWSYQLVSAQEQTLLSSLGTLSGPFDVVAAGSVSGQDDAAAVLEPLTELADQSVIEVIPGAIPRFQLPQTVREYALAQLAEAAT
jgi:predicted ATPase